MRLSGAFGLPTARARRAFKSRRGRFSCRFLRSVPAEPRRKEPVNFGLGILLCATLCATCVAAEYARRGASKGTVDASQMAFYRPGVDPVGFRPHGVRAIASGVGDHRPTRSISANRRHAADASARDCSAGPRRVPAPAASRPIRRPRRVHRARRLCLCDWCRHHRQRRGLRESDDQRV